MSEEPNKDTNNGGNAGDDPNKGKGNDPANNKGNDPAKGGEGENQMIPKSRFDEVNTELKDLRAWKEEQEAKAKKAEDKKLQADKKWEELATKRSAEAEALKAQLTDAKIRSAVAAEAYKNGAIDVNDIVALVDKAKVQVDKDGNVTGVEEAVKALVDSKPHLFGEGKPASTVGAGSNPKTNQEKTYPISWVREKWADVAWARAEHDEHEGLTGEEFLNKLEAEGRIDYTS